ncbi:hypothetical protein QZH41_001908 [Actinostola sp. cb2023]|nr:hypothetical protein QZH41_001908 [Actinostola sp. cb2023]
MDDHSDQSEITSSEEEHSDDSSPENFTDDSQESESSESNYGSSDSADNQSLPQCWTTLIDEAMGRHEVKVESLMEEYEHQAKWLFSKGDHSAFNGFSWIVLISLYEPLSVIDEIVLESDST